MKVKCINADFSKSKEDVVKSILLVGDNDLLPKENEEYEVIGCGLFDDGEGYELAEIDTSHYGKKLLFDIKRFIVSDDTFIPNALTDDWGFGKRPCKKINFYVNLTK